MGTNRFRISNILVWIVLSASAATADNYVEPEGHPPMPASQDEFDRYVRSIEDGTGGDRANMIQHLTRAGFSCNPISKAFNCVRLGCKKRFLGRDSLLQWQVGQKLDREQGLAYAPFFVDYRSLLKCVAEKDLKAAEQRFLRGEGVE